MVLLLNDPAFIEGMWASANKDEKNRAVYTQEELENMWIGGFIDTERIKLDDWIDALDPYKLGDSKFHFDYDQFVSLDQYRYKGEIRIPFDPMNVENGKYTEESIDQLFDLTIKTSCSLPYADLKNYAEEFKKIYRIPNGDLINVNEDARLQLVTLLEDYPSPLRNLEILLDNLFSMAERFLAEQGVDVSRVAQIASESMFSKNPLTTVEKKAMDLKNLTKAKPKEEKIDSEKQNEGVSLKDIKRSKRGVRG